jgi:hyperosmotically inducible periplasmic protein
MKARLLALALTGAIGLTGVPFAWAADPSTTSDAAQSAPDNSGRNKRDRSGDTLTSGDQGNSQQDVDLTKRIRQQVVKDDQLSTMAHNVKIITVNGVVTLRGPVKTPDEKQRVVAMAERIAGQGHVKDHLEIAQ